MTILVAPILVALLSLGGVEVDQIRSLLIPLTPLVTGIVAVAISGLGNGSPRALFGSGRMSARLSIIAALLGVAAFLLLNVVFGALVVALLQLLGVDPPSMQESLRSAARRSDALPILAFSTIVVAPIGEELLYRGLLVQAFLNRFGKTGAMLWSAVVFALGHAAIGAPALSNVVLAVLILPLGVVLAWTFLRWGTLWVPIVVHAVFNGITVAVMAAGLV